MQKEKSDGRTCTWHFGSHSIDQIRSHIDEPGVNEAGKYLLPWEAQHMAMVMRLYSPGGEGGKEISGPNHVLYHNH